MSDNRLIDALAAGGRRASIHALRAAGEVVSAVTAFVDELARAFAEPDEGPEHIEVESDEGPA